MVRNEKKMTVFFVTGFILPVSLCLFLCLSSCKLKSDKENSLSISFGKIYDKTDTSGYTALDIKQTEGDGRYIILGEVDGHPYLLKIDAQGNFKWDSRDNQELEDYKNPVPELRILNHENNTYYYFFCTRQSGDKVIPVLLKFNDKDNTLYTADEISSYINHYEAFNIPYYITPKYASISGDKRYVLMTLNNLGDIVVFAGEEGISDNWREKINDQTYWAGWACLTTYLATDRKYHYSGRLKNNDIYYLHTFQQDSFNVDEKKCFLIEIELPFPTIPQCGLTLFLEYPLIAMDWDDSQWDGSGFKGLKLSGAYIAEGMVYFFINTEINEDTTSPGIELDKKNEQSELLTSKPVYIKTRFVEGKEIVFFAAADRKNKIVLYAYEKSSGDFLNKRYFGDIRIYEAAGLIDTYDGGLAILGNTFVMDQLGRICVFKLSKTEVEDLCSQQE
jgi:hypothetical protein